HLRSVVRLPFFFQAEDGIRDRNVTGVQTCALPILPSVLSTSGEPTGFRLADVEEEPGRAPPADAPEPPWPRVGEAHVEIVDVFGGGEEPHGPTQHEDPRTQRRDPDEGEEAYPKKDGVEDAQ